MRRNRIPQELADPRYRFGVLPKFGETCDCCGAEPIETGHAFVARLWLFTSQQAVERFKETRECQECQ